VARRATVIETKRAQETNLLLVDNGNFVRGKGAHHILKAEYMAKSMSRMEYDAINVGREEIVLGTDQMRRLQELHRLPLVSSNLLQRDKDRQLFSPYLIKRVGASNFLGFRYGGIKVALVGATLWEQNDPMRRMIPNELQVDPPAPVLSEILQKLRRHCDLVVLLSDLDLENAKKLAQQVEGIDLFFVGAGTRAKFVEEIEGTIFVYPARKADELGDMELILSEDGGVDSYTVEWTLLDDTIADDPEMAQLIEEYEEEKEKLQRTPPR
jgi:2',3'-cyclic-nucleotide 2'-phosphodiesterase/3'-nucleotidase